jgi:signal-transduction protein with cAMP-binding, CBS, and nucleotidyltransferase domain
MSSPVVTIDHHLSAEDAANLMLQEKVRHLIVKDGIRSIGIISASNFIYYLDEQLFLNDPSARVLKTLKDEI